MVVTSGQGIGPYRIESILGRGASSIVYRAADRDGRILAVKAIREELLVGAEREATLERFYREARIGEALDHPHIVRLFDWGEHDGVPYIVMDLIIGEGFDVLLRRSGPLAPGRACSIMAAVLDALAYVHDRRIIHRDLKPANVVIRAAQQAPVLMDFGIARVDGATLTQFGALLGTPAYMAPEQLRGETVDERADIFAAGIMLFEATTGQRPFEGSVAEIMRKICFDDPPPAAAFAPQLARLEPIFARALDKNPSRRFPSAAAFAEALRSLGFAAEGAVELAPAVEMTIIEPIAATMSLGSLQRLLARALADGIDSESSVLIRQSLARLPAQQEWQAATLCFEHGLRPLIQQLDATAPLPGSDADGETWRQGAGLAQALLLYARRGPEARAAEALVADLAHRLTLGVLAFGSDVAERLTAEDAPDVSMMNQALLQIDEIAAGLGALGTAREKLLVEASGRLVAGQILRRSAGFMQAYALTRDPLARFDVVNLLVQVKDLIALATRLVDHAGEDAVATRSTAALTAFLEAITQLVSVSEELLEEALAEDDDAALAAFTGHLKQLRLIYWFGTRLEGAAFRRELAVMAQNIYGVCAHLTGQLTTGAATATLGHRRITALYEMAEDLDWRELATELLAHSRRSVLLRAADPQGGGSGTGI